MEEVTTKEARGGVSSPKHNVLTVLIVSLVLAMAVWFVVETFF